uniref:C-type lectin n=1 Tax=Pristionchus pacificus TaxID=54126 RepID=A0A8R1V031_PRIPA
MISFCLAVLIACLLHNEGAATTAATEIGSFACCINTKLEDGEVRADRPYAKKCTACERWIMERRNSKIALASLCERGKYLQARADGSVGVGSTMDLWTWHGKQGESSSFMSANGSWLSANKNGTVYAAKERSFDGLWIVPLA